MPANSFRMVVAHKSGEQQVRFADNRQQLTSYVDEQAHGVIDNVSEDREAGIKACRDRALVYFFSYSGGREAKIFRDNSDERRQGLRWEDVSLTDRYITVFTKKQHLDDRGLLGTVVYPFEAHQRVPDAPGPN